MKINISIIADQMPHPAVDLPQNTPSLCDKIEYAIECIENDHKKQDAILFLRKVYQHLNTKKTISREDTEMMQQIAPVLGDYGMYYGKEK